MGRLEIPVKKKSSWREELEWKQRCKTERSRKETLLVHPPARRRQMALLWYISAIHEGGTIVGSYGPPLTPDMRELIAKNFLNLKRKRITSDCITSKNWVVLTEIGQRVVERVFVSNDDKRYIISAANAGALR